MQKNDKTVFKSKCDLWVAAIIIASMGMCIYAIIDIIQLGNVKHYPIAIVIAVLGTGMPAWMLLDTKYTITSEELMIQSGPFKQAIALACIERVSESHSALASPALSLDRLMIQYRQGRVVLVSPKDKQELIETLNIN